MREWLRVCDNHKDHKEYGCHSDSDSVLPTPVPDVKRRTFTKSIRLYSSKNKEIGEYIALSHCWGDFKSEERTKFCTFKQTIEPAAKGIDIDELPRLFKKRSESLVTRQTLSLD
jgi:hypothetical protein